MPDTYKPQHKKKRHPAASASRGPDRWARAAHNAIIRPNSHEARLYQKRVRLAVEYRELAENILDANVPIVFLKWQGGRDYIVCSHYCAAMQAQLDRGASTLVGIIRSLEVGNHQIEHNSTRTRAMRCQCCGSTVERNA